MKSALTSGNGQSLFGLLGFVSKVPLPIREGLGEGRVARRFSPSPSLSPEGRGVLRQSLSILALSFVCLLVAPTAAQEASLAAIELHVSTTGDDSWSGTLAAPNADRSDGPLATLEAARDRLRQLRRVERNQNRPVTVWIAGGIYELKRSWQLTGEDSGTALAPVVYRACEDATVRLVGGRVLGGWQPVTEASVRQRLVAAARDEVLQVTLPAAVAQQLTPIQPGSSWASSEPGLELFFQDRPMTLARWPNDGFVSIAAVHGPTPVDVRGTKGCKEGILEYAGDRPDRWKDEPEIMLHGYWFWDWADQRLRVESIDTAERRIRLEAKPEHAYGFRKGQWFYAYNLLAEIDQPGEWYLDRQQARLYFWPPGPVDDGHPTISLLPSLVTSKQASHITLRNLILECAQQTAVTIEGGEGVLIAGCVIRNVGGWAVKIDGATDSGVIGCDIYATGDGGISLSGGDRRTLTPAGLFAENNHIHHFSRWNPVYRPAVMLQGVGQRVSHLLIHDAPHMAIGLGGNDHLIELNEIHSVVYGSNDAGVIYAGRDATMRGHRIQYNYIHHVYGHEGKGCVGVYLDDMFCSATIYGNLFFQVPRAAFIGGGRDNIVENNIFVECNPALHIDARALGWAAYAMKTLQERLQNVPYREEPWRSRYPQLLDYLNDEPAVPKGNVITRNICWKGRWDEIEPQARPGLRLENNLVEQDPRFVAPEQGDFRLQEDSPAHALGFVRIPLERIGLYPSEDRASWPVRALRPAETLSGGSVFLFYATGFGQEEARQKADTVDEQGDKSRRVADPLRGCLAEHMRCDRGRDPSEGGTEHPSADVGGKALTGTSQVHRIHPRQVVAPETELCHREQPCQQHSDRHGGHGQFAQVERTEVDAEEVSILDAQEEPEHQRHHQQTWTLKHAQQRAAAEDSHRQQRKQQAPQQATYLLHFRVLCRHLLLDRPDHPPLSLAVLPHRRVPLCGLIEGGFCLGPHIGQTGYDLRNLLNRTERRAVAASEHDRGDDRRAGQLR